MKHLHSRLVTAAVTTVALLATGALVAPAATAASPTQPILKKWANPGVAKLSTGGYVMTHTVAWNKPEAFATAPRPNGPWKRAKTTLLTKKPAWANGSKRVVWAPSIIRGSSGKWVVFYSALLPGKGASRCIGTGTADTATGPYMPDARPISCFKGSKTKPQDLIRNEGKTSLIDATPAVVNGQTVLTYKTSHAYKQNKRQMWHTTIRMVALDPATPNRVIGNPVNVNGRSIQLTSARSKYIEENPSLVFRAGKYTLFTSWGWYGTHDQYWTRFRQMTELWGDWGKKKPARVSFPKGANTRGWGNAQAVRAPQGGWVLFWNGQEPPKKFTRGEGPKYLYVGKIDWRKGKPFVRKLLTRA